MDKLFYPAIEENVFIYLDDIIIVNDTFEDYVKALQKVYKILKRQALRLMRKNRNFVDLVYSSSVLW